MPHDIDPVSTHPAGGGCSHHFDLSQKEIKVPGDWVTFPGPAPFQRLAGPTSNQRSQPSVWSHRTRMLRYYIRSGHQRLRGTQTAPSGGGEGKGRSLCSRNSAPLKCACRSFAGKPMNSLLPQLESHLGTGPVPGATDRRAKRFPLSRSHKLVWGADEEMRTVTTTWH